MYLATITLSAISGFFYRLGGSADKPKWFFKARDLWCGVCVIAWLSLEGISSWLFIPCLGLMWGALSTYWSFLSKTDDEVWWNYALHGFFIGFALFPLSIAGDIGWLPLLYRSLVLSFSIGLYSHFVKNDIIEEVGRGALIILTLLILGV